MTKLFKFIQKDYNKLFQTNLNFLEKCNSISWKTFP